MNNIRYKEINECKENTDHFKSLVRSIRSTLHMDTDKNFKIYR